MPKNSEEYGINILKIQTKKSFIHDFLSMSHKKPNTLEGQYNIIYTFFQDNSKNLDKNQSNDVVKMSQSRKELLK